MPILHRVGYGRIRQSRDTPAQQRQRHAASAQFGTDTVPVRQRLRGCGLSSAGANNLRSRAVSSSSAGIGQVMPITPARRCTRQSPCDRCPAIARTLAHLPPHGYFRRRTSLSSASTISRRHWPLPLARIAKGGPCPLRLPAVFSASPYQHGWPPSIGIGGRSPSESVTAFPQIPHASPCARGPLWSCTYPCSNFHKAEKAKSFATRPLA